MKDSETVDRFILLRAQGWSYNRIQAELKISRPTLITWSRIYQIDIANERDAETEALAERLFRQRHERWEILSRQLKQLEAALDKQDFKDTPPAQLHKLAAELRAEISREVGEMKFEVDRRDIDRDEVPIRHKWPA